MHVGPNICGRNKGHDSMRIIDGKIQLTFFILNRVFRITAFNFLCRN